LMEQSIGMEYSNVARGIKNLAALLSDTNLLAQAERYESSLSPGIARGIVQTSAEPSNTTLD
jgi:hypothetical protein